MKEIDNDQFTWNDLWKVFGLWKLTHWMYTSVNWTVFRCGSTEYIFVKHQLWDGQDLLVYSGKSLNIHKYDFIHLSWQWCGFRGWCFLISYWLVFTTCKAEQPLKSIDLKKKRQIWKASRRMDYKEPKDNRCLFSLDLKLFK